VTAAGGPAPEWFGANLAVVPDEGHVTVDGVAVRWLRWGDAAKPPLALVHGGGAHAQWWSFLAPFLADDWCVVAPDLSGMGQSGWRQAYRTETWAEEVLAVVADAVPAARARPVLAGHSLGGSVVAVAAARHPERLAGVVLCDIGVRKVDEKSRSGRHFVNRRTYPSREEAVRRFKLIPRQPCANDWAVAHIAATSVRPVGAGGADDPTRPPPGDEIGWAWKFDWRLFTRTYDKPLRDYLGDITVPVACLHGAHSRIVTPEVAQRVVDCLGREVPTVWVPEAGHHLMLDQPLAFIAGLRGLLALFAFQPARHG
jgi:pimeloyl-ACP methyl ester carboxylesterase